MLVLTSLRDALHLEVSPVEANNPSKTSMPKPVIVTVAIAAVIVGGLIVILAQPPAASQPGAVVSPSASSVQSSGKTIQTSTTLFAPTPAWVVTNNVETSSWKTYRNVNYGYEFEYPSDFRVAHNFMGAFSRSHAKDDVVLLTAASGGQEIDYLAKIGSSTSVGINIARDATARTFAQEGVLITPGLPGDLEYLRKRSGISTDLQRQRLGYVAFDYRNVKDIVSRDGTRGLEFTFSEYVSATDTQSLPITEAIFPLKREGIFPEWNILNAQGSSTVQIKIPADSPDSTRWAFERIVESISFF
jgi:hypothetical protein